MELTTRGRYAVMAMADIALQDAGTAQPLSQIAERQKLPLPYLEQLFLSLRRAGLVDSARGRLGGYRLARAASEISVLDVMAAVEEETHFTRCHGEQDGCVAGEKCLTHGLWQGLSNAAAGYLKSMSLADVVANAATGKTERSGSGRPRRLYLDYNATAPLLATARQAMIAALDVVGNASSVHAEGRRARGIVETAREKVAALVNAKASEVVFTSGATEANAAVFAQGWQTIFLAGIEHDSVLAPARASGARLIDIPVGRDGVARLDAVARSMLSSPPMGRALIVMQAANNETGVLQPVAAAAALAREHGISLHVDAVQAAGRVPVDFAVSGITTMSLSSHKIGGPKGIGALLIRDRVDLAPFIRGGGQERRRRGGTENVAAIAGFGAAAAEAQVSLANFADIAQLRDLLEAGVRAVTPEAVIIGTDVPRLANTSTLALPGKPAENLVIKFDLLGLAVSAGAACSSGKVGASHVLASMGLSPEIAASAIRISIGPETTAEDIATFLAAWKEISRPALAA